MPGEQDRRLYLRASLKAMAAIMLLALLLAFCAPVGAAPLNAASGAGASRAG